MTEVIKTVNMADHHVDDVVRIEQSISIRPWPASIFLSEMKNPTHILIVAVLNEELHPGSEKVVGFTGGQLVSDELHVHSLAVSQDHRRNGIGRNLIQNLILQSIERDAHSATLEVRASNIPAIDLYKSLGFQMEGLRSKYYADNGEDAVIMWLRSFEGLMQ